MTTTALPHRFAAVSAQPPTHGLSTPEWRCLQAGEVLVKTASHSERGGQVNARIWLPLVRESVWTQITHYSRWVEFFPDIVHSEICGQGALGQRLYQVARRSFLMLNVQVQIWLRVQETLNERVAFSLERGDFSDFSACLDLSDCASGTLLSYTVKATPTLPLPSMLIQQGMHCELPANLRHLRRALCPLR